jgi:hypothetical protein
LYVSISAEDDTVPELKSIDHIKLAVGVDFGLYKTGFLGSDSYKPTSILWVCHARLAQLKDLGYKTDQTVYQLKSGLLSNYLIQKVKRPAISMFWS